MTLHSERIGQGADLVLVHGWGMGSVVWGDLALRLAETFRVTLVDLPGHGASPWQGESSLAQWAQACRVAAPERALWIGWSLGAQVAIRAALDAPGRVGALLCVAGTPRFTQGEDWPHAMAPNTLTEFERALRGDHQGTLARFLALQVQGSQAGRATLRELRQRLAEAPQPQPQALEVGLSLLATVDLRAALADLHCPTRSLLGSRDTLAPARVAQDLQRLRPEAEVQVIHGAGHAPFLSHPEAVLEAVRTLHGAMPT
jgi:pimeloyl-[acyl-carrier protein] methyl ester esterase